MPLVGESSSTTDPPLPLLTEEHVFTGDTVLKVITQHVQAVPDAAIAANGAFQHPRTSTASTTGACSIGDLAASGPPFCPVQDFHSLSWASRPSRNQLRKSSHTPRHSNPQRPFCFWLFRARPTDCCRSFHTNAKISQREGRAGSSVLCEWWAQLVGASHVHA
jgi:hypothetical protein